MIMLKKIFLVGVVLLFLFESVFAIGIGPSKEIIDLLDKYYKIWDGSNWQLLPREVYKNLFASSSCC